MENGKGQNLSSTSLLAVLRLQLGVLRRRMQLAGVVVRVRGFGELGKEGQ